MERLRGSLGLLAVVTMLAGACGRQVTYSTGGGTVGTGGSGGSSGTHPGAIACTDGPKEGDPCAHVGELCGGYGTSCYPTTSCTPAKKWHTEYPACTTAGSGGNSCSAAGTWDGVSGIDGTNPSTSASYVFNADGTWIGGKYQQDVPSTKFMTGTYSVNGGVLTLNGSGMGPYCAASVNATYGLTFSPDCSSAKLLTQTDGCTGGRLYLSASPDGTALTRRP